MEDIDLNLDDFVARVNSDLVGKYVNIASRAAGFIAKHFGGELQVQRRYRPARSRRPQARGTRVARAATTRASSAERSATSWRRPTASTRASTQRSRGTLAKDPARARELQNVCSRALHGLQAADGAARTRSLPALAAARRPRAFRARPRFHVGRRAGSLPDAHQALQAPHDAHRREADRARSSKPTAKRCEPDAGSRRRAAKKQEKAVETATETQTISIDDFAQDRPAHRAHRQRRARRRRGQAAEAHARRRRARHEAGLRGHQVGLRSRERSRAGSPSWSRTSRRAR